LAKAVALVAASVLDSVFGLGLRRSGILICI